VGRRRGRAPRAVPGAALIFGRGRFDDLIRRQLDLFEDEHRADLDEAAERLDRYHAAGRDEAEELYGDYVDTVDAVTDALLDLRDTYAATLDDEAADRYVRAFDRAARRRSRIPPRQ
jgi:hypothetical protein